MKSFSNGLADTLAGHGWMALDCPRCGRQYFGKRSSSTCGAWRCEGGYGFLHLSSPRKFLDVALASDLLRTFLAATAYPTTDPVPIVRNRERTIFASTAGHVFDPFIYGESAAPRSSASILQPV